MRRSRLQDLEGVNPYHVLGILPNANRNEIISAHRRRIREFHPDLPVGDAAQARLLNLARDVLLDPELKAEYDRSASAGDVTSKDGNLRQKTSPPPKSPHSFSVWDSQDVVVGYQPQSHTPAWAHIRPPEQSVYQPPPVPHQQSNGLPVLPVLALIMAPLFAPIGFVLAVVSLVRIVRTSGLDRAISVAAFVVSCIMCCFMYIPLVFKFLL